MGYRVTDTREIQALTPAGTERVTYRVWLVTDLGATGTVDVSSEDWNRESLEVILAEKAAALDLAFSLGS